MIKWNEGKKANIVNKNTKEDQVRLVGSGKASLIQVKEQEHRRQEEQSGCRVQRRK